MCAANERQPLITKCRVRLVRSSRSWSKEHSLMWQTHIEIGAEFDGLGGASLESAASVTTMARDALPEDLNEQLRI